MPTHNLILTLIRTAEEFQLLDVFMAGSGKLLPDDLKIVKIPEGLDRAKGVIITGRGPTWLYAYLTLVLSGFPWIATHAVVDGGATVVNADSSRSRYSVGDLIPVAAFQSFLPKHEEPPKPKPTPQTGAIAVAFVGPPNSGKSVLMNALRLALQQRLSAELYQRGVYVLRACPDGEGDWFSEISAEEGKLLRYKSAFDDEFVQKAVSELIALKQQKQLLLVDCGGRIDRKNQQILNLCTHAIIVSSVQSAFGEWRGAVGASDVEVMAEVESSLEKDAVCLETSPLRIRIGPLDRERKDDIELPKDLVHKVLSFVKSAATNHF